MQTDAANGQRSSKTRKVIEENALCHHFYAWKGGSHLSETLFLSDLARSDMDEIGDHIAQDDLNAADSIIDDLLANHPSPAGHAPVRASQAGTGAESVIVYQACTGSTWRIFPVILIRG